MCICFSNFKPRWNYDSSTFLFLPLRSERNVRDMILRKTSQINFMSELLLELGVHKSICQFVALSILCQRKSSKNGLHPKLKILTDIKVLNKGDKDHLIN